MLICVVVCLHFAVRSNHEVKLARERQTFLETIVRILRQFEIVEAGFNASQKAADGVILEASPFELEGRAVARRLTCLAHLG
jgi:hypothetical protein